MTSKTMRETRALTIVTRMITSTSRHQRQNQEQERHLKAESK